jgi:hexosaminidase
MLNANVDFPGLTIRYTTDGTEPTLSSTVYTVPVAVKGVVKLKAFTTTGRSSRTVVLQ